MADAGGATGLHVVHRPGPPGAPRVLLVHGAMDRASSFSRLVAHLPDVDIVTYDRRGYGRSTRRPSDHFTDQVADLLEVLDGVPVRVALGHSYGGALVLAAAERRPDLVPAAVVWEAPIPPVAGEPRRPVIEGSDPADRAERFVRRAIGDRIWDRLPSTTRARRRAEGPSLDADLASLADPGWSPPAVRVPVIVGRGGRSIERHGRTAERLAAWLPDATLVTIDDADHGAHLGHAPNLARLVREAGGLGPAGVGTTPARGAGSVRHAGSTEEDRP